MGGQYRWLVREKPVHARHSAPRGPQLIKYRPQVLRLVGWFYERKAGHGSILTGKIRQGLPDTFFKRFLIGTGGKCHVFKSDAK